MKTKIKIIITTFLCILAFGIFYSCEDQLEETKLQVEFTVETQNVIAGHAIVFNDISEGDPSRWNWVFENGTPSTSVLSCPEVVYDTPGTYSVKLTIGKRDDSISITKDAFIVVEYGAILANFSESETTIVQGQSITFTDLSQGLPTSWLWEFISVDGGNTLTSNEKNPTITFEDYGVYTVKLTATNPKGSDEIIKTNLLTIIDASSVEANFKAVAQGTYEEGTVSFNDATLGTVNSWEWTFEGGSPATSSEQNPTVTYNSVGRYKVKLVASNDFKSSEKEIEDYILVVSGSGLVAFYPFDGSGDDVGPNQVNTSNQETGTVTFDQMDRKSINNVASFDGSSVLVAPDNSAFNFGTNDFSIACWIKTDITSKMMIWQESGSNGGGDNQAWLRIGDNSTSRKMRFAVEDATGGTILNLPNGVSDNNWHHVICMRSGLTSSVYIDGALILTKEASVIKEVSSTQNFKIGAQETGGGGTYSNKYAGLLDELIIYNRTLSDDEIKSLYEQ